MYILEFGRGKDKRKRKKRNSLLRNTAIVAGSAGLGAGAALAATRKRRESIRSITNDIQAVLPEKFRNPKLADQVARRDGIAMGGYGALTGGGLGLTGVSLAEIRRRKKERKK
jgi:hypothetical protein